VFVNPDGSIERAALDWNPQGTQRLGWETKEDMEKICRRGNRRKRKYLERGEEYDKRQNKMEKLHISPMLRKEQQEIMDGKHNVSETGFCLHLQGEPTKLEIWISSID
jgi:hypothetical protein